MAVAFPDASVISEPISGTFGLLMLRNGAFERSLLKYSGETEHLTAVGQRFLVTHFIFGRLFVNILTKPTVHSGSRQVRPTSKEIT